MFGIISLNSQPRSWVDVFPAWVGWQNRLKHSAYLRNINYQWTFKPDSQRHVIANLWGNVLSLNSYHMKMGCYLMFLVWRTTFPTTYSHGPCPYILKSRTRVQPGHWRIHFSHRQGDFITTVQSIFCGLWISDPCILFPNVPSPSGDFYYSLYIRVDRFSSNHQYRTVKSCIFASWRILHIAQWV